MVDNTECHKIMPPTLLKIENSFKNAIKFY